MKLCMDASAHTLQFSQLFALPYLQWLGFRVSVQRGCVGAMFIVSLGIRRARRQQGKRLTTFRCSEARPPPRRKEPSRDTSGSLEATAQRSRNGSSNRQKAGVLSSAVPFEVLVRIARFTWKKFWLLLMEQLAPSKARSGSYDRPPPAFVSDAYRKVFSENQIAESQLVLFYGRECPWCHRCLLAVNFYSLGDATSGYPSVASVRVYPSPEGKWVLSRTNETVAREEQVTDLPMRYQSARDLREIYRKTDPSFIGRATAPLLIDLRASAIVSNESSDIVRFLRDIAMVRTKNLMYDLYPPDFQPQIEQDRKMIHEQLNNGVYKAGFAKTQTAYNDAEKAVFETLQLLEERLAGQRYVSGTPGPSESDIFLFPTLIRFDSVYHTLFRCSRRKLTEFHNLHAWMRDLIQTYPGELLDTFHVEETMTSYFQSLFPLNPSGIVPSCDIGSLTDPHGRERLGSSPRRAFKT